MLYLVLKDDEFNGKDKKLTMLNQGNVDFLNF